MGSAQTFELGPYGGGANVIGDVGSTNYIAPTGPMAGIMFRWNRSTRHSFRATLVAARLNGDDSDSDDISRQLRDYSYAYNLYEATIGAEYTFWDWELYSGTPQFTPFMYVGVSAYRQVSFRLNPAATPPRLNSYDNAYGFAVPFNIGVKYTLTRRLILTAEVGARYTFTDNLDGSNPTGDFEDRPDLQFGNINNNDWYVFSGISLTYTFGRQPCYCNF